LDIVLYGVLPVLIAIAMTARQITPIRQGGLRNPDSYMRLVRLRETLAAGYPMDVVTADASGHGTVLHWSHLLDSLLCILAVPFNLFLPLDEAVHAAALLVGPLGLASLGVATAWAAAPFANRAWLWLAPVLVCLSPAILAYGVPGVVHHHVLVVLAAVMAWGWGARLVTGYSAAGRGWALGAWAGLGLWLTPESLPLTLLPFGALWMAWIANVSGDGLGRAIRNTGLGFLLTVAGAYSVDPSFEGPAAAEIDRLSTVFVGLATAIAGSGLAIAWFDRLQGRWPRLASSLLSSLTAAGVWLACFPTVLRGSVNMLSPEEWHAFMDPIVEMTPIDNVADAVRYLLTGALTGVLLAGCAYRRRSLLLGYAALSAGGLLVAGQMHVRFAAYPEAAGAVLLPVAVTMIERQTSGWSEPTQRYVRLAAIMFVVLVPWSGRFAHAAKPPSSAPSCSLTGMVPLLLSHAGQVVLADVSDTPELLYRTPVRTVGSLYHRNPMAFLRLRAAWRSVPSETIGSAVAATGASLVLACEGAGRSSMVADLPPVTLLDRLERGEAPRWLHRIAADSRSGQVMYEVMQ
jgi:hypothetical protein